MAKCVRWLQTQTERVDVLFTKEHPLSLHSPVLLLSLYVETYCVRSPWLRCVLSRLTRRNPKIRTSSPRLVQVSTGNMEHVIMHTLLVCMCFKASGSVSSSKLSSFFWGGGAGNKVHSLTAKSPCLYGDTHIFALKSLSNWLFGIWQSELVA